MKTPCTDDSCDGSHCRKCGSHFIDFYTTETVCESCGQQENFEWEERKKVKDHSEVSMFWYGTWGIVFFPSTWQPWEMSRLCQMFPGFNLDTKNRKATLHITE